MLAVIFLALCPRWSLIIIKLATGDPCGERIVSPLSASNAHAVSAKNVEIVDSLFGFLEPIHCRIVHTYGIISCQRF